MLYGGGFASMVLGNIKEEVKDSCPIENDTITLETWQKYEKQEVGNGMKFRGLTWDEEKQTYKWVYGLPSYGFETEEIAEIGTPYGDFYNINPATLGKQTKYRDRHSKPIYTGDITVLNVNGELREFEVVEITTDREYNTLPGIVGGTVKVRLSGVIAFRWRAPDGEVFDLLPCVNEEGVSDTELMEIIDTAAERAVRESESASKKQ